MADFMEVPAQSVIVRAHCACGTELERDGDIMQLTLPPMIGYRCPSCGATESLAEFFPKVIARPLDETK